MTSELEIFRRANEIDRQVRKRQLEEFHALPNAVDTNELVELCAHVIQTETTVCRLTPEIAQRILALVDLAGIK